ncbi:bifunctional methylenetetrahydrofolate dehydrogenase/methenyltetrahydrofolate cyclohydrolase [Candidatus Microgenomates bacterium]|nr:bifunctional methylenetetrahydrofolate dehydrogenase/methenyltetrahydrofolate cyclohydrolase [Candidatus Microgenomates bacterium]
MTNIFDGKKFARKKELDLEKKVQKLRSKKIFPHFASILIGSDTASLMYINMKKKRGEKIGIEMSVHKFPKATKSEDIVELIKLLNDDKQIHGIMIQLPIPSPLDKHTDEFIKMIAPKKDVDGLKADSLYIHPTSKAIYEILKLAEKKEEKRFVTVAVVGATGMVGNSLSKVLGNHGYNTIKCNSKTTNLKDKTKVADVVISATGKSGLITKDYIKNEAVVIDVGSPQGDVNFEDVKDKVSFMTPVPNGVGPVTISCLLENVVNAI